MAPQAARKAARNRTTPQSRKALRNCRAPQGGEATRHPQVDEEPQREKEPQGAKKLQRVTELPQSAEDSQGAEEPKYCCNRLCHHKPPSEKQMFEPAQNLYFFALLMAVPPAWEAWLFVFFSRF